MGGGTQVHCCKHVLKKTKTKGKGTFFQLRICTAGKALRVLKCHILGKREGGFLVKIYSNSSDSNYRVKFEAKSLKSLSRE